jgi:hypothetical protein
MWGRELLGTESAPYPMANHKRTIDDANSRFTLKVHFTWTASGSLDLYWVSCTADTLLKSNNDRRGWLWYGTVLDGKRPLE